MTWIEYYTHLFFSIEFAKTIPINGASAKPSFSCLRLIKSNLHGWRVCHYEGEKEKRAMMSKTFLHFPYLNFGNEEISENMFHAVFTTSLHLCVTACGVVD